jgi:exosortase/archaeosortase family protein
MMRYSLRRVVLLAAGILFLAWLIPNLGRITADDDGFIRFVLGGLFAVLILCRSLVAPRGAAVPDPGAETAAPARGRRLAALGAAGALFSLAGIIFSVRQFEWLGLIVILYACLRWALPERCGRDVLLGLFLLYWIHPLPGQVFGAFQLAMQWLSVQGSEWVLQAANVRIWADGFVLRMGLRTFGVPEACSGMRTAVTVLLCTLGVGMLFRFRWYETVGFMALGLAQVLVLNIARIALMVVWSARMPVEWSQTFLHDTLGVFLLIAMLIVQGEASWYKVWKTARRRRREGIARGELERPDRASPLPHVWRLARRWGFAAAVALLVVLGIAFAVYKRRPEHRATMIREVVDGLIEHDLDAARKGIDAVLALTPGERAARFTQARIQVLGGQFEQAYACLDGFSPPLSVEEAALKSRVLVALRRPNEAAEIIEALPESALRLPGVALIRAEYAALLDRPREVSAYIRVAAQSHLTIDRRRMLYPYLASREQWAAIVDSDSDQPYAHFIPALAAAQAALRMNNIPHASRVLRNATRQWPRDPRLLPALSAGARARPGEEWEALFAENLRANLPRLAADRLGGLLDDCFRMVRPDLAWQVYRALERLDPSDPSLLLAPAQFGEAWFTVRRRTVGLQSGALEATVDLAPICRQSRFAPPFRSVWEQVPVLEAMLDPRTERVRRTFLESSVAEFARREEADALTVRMQMAYPIALAKLERYAEAHRRLDRIMERYPDREAEALFQHAVFYDEQADWQRAYEALARYGRVAETPNLFAHMLLVNALMNLDLGVAAMETVRRARAVFPGAPRLDLAEASIWNAFGFKEQALHVIESSTASAKSYIVVHVLRETGRFEAARRLAAVLGMRDVGALPDVEQNLRPAPAELVVKRRWPEPLDDAGMDREAARYAAAQREAASPFMRDLNAACAAWYRGRGAADLSNPERWTALGRDTLEQASALNRLTTFLAWRGRYAEAERAARAAVALLPEAPVLRRILVALTEGEPEDVTAARGACPNDPHIWLAELVTRVNRAADGDADARAWARAFIEDAVASRRFSAGTMTRAGDFLLRKGWTEAATVAARDAVARARGLLEAYVLGLRCAVLNRDEDWALSCALQGIDHARDPSPFYKTVVELKASGRKTDQDMIAALEYLHERFPRETTWAEQLARIYFEKRDTGRALSILRPAMASDLGLARVQSLIVAAAEAARLEGDLNRAVEILEVAYALYPDNLNVLNNLVYSYAQKTEWLPQARALLDTLLEKAGNTFAVLDTAAVVYLRSGQLDLANQYMTQALERVDADSYAASEMRLNAAEILYRMGKYERALESLEHVRRDPDRSREVEEGVRRLRENIEAKLLKQ